MNSLVVVGFMSGTSMDGLDCCIAEISINSNEKLKYKIIAQKSFDFSSSLKVQIKKHIGNRCEYEIVKFDKYLGSKFLDLSKDFLLEYSFDCIALHGQTIHHKDRVSTLQVGSPLSLASFFQVPVIYNFRQKDINVGGNGAPLMPFLDWLIFKNSKKNILTLNIGGISNISFIPKDSNKNQVIGFDTGPGMCLIDQCVEMFWLEDLDQDAKYSISGNINLEMLDCLINTTPFINQSIPKSTGREQFGKFFLNKIIENFKSLDKVDILRTLIKFTSLSIKMNIDKFILNKFKIDKLVISGGGISHPILMNDIKKDLDIPTLNIIDYGIESKFKESFLMALLGYAKIKNIKSNLPSVTGSSKNSVLGEIYESK